MSWAAHNPEKYDEICRRGIAVKLAMTTLAWSNETSSVETLESVVDSLQQEAPKV